MCAEKKKSRKKEMAGLKKKKKIKVDKQRLKAMSYMVLFPCAPEML